MVKLTHAALQAFFKKQGYSPDFQAETGQIYFPLKIDTQEFPFFARIFEESGLLQMLIFLPCQLSPKTLADVARLLHMFNKELDIPGFGMDEVSGVVFFRCMVPSSDKQVQESTLIAFLNTIQTVAKAFGPAVAAVASGAITFEALLAKVKEGQQ